MANNLDAFTPEYWSQRVQRLLRQKLIARELANTEERSTLSNGDIVHRPYHSTLQVNDYTIWTAVTAQDVTATDEYLTVDQTKEVSIYIDPVHKIQNKYDTANKMTSEMAYRLKQDIDGKFLAEVANASYTLDDSSFGGTAGDPVTLSASNLLKWFTLAKATLNNNNVEEGEWFTVVTPNVEALMTQAMINQGYKKADDSMSGTGQGNGYLCRFMDFDIYSSTQVYHVNKWTSTAIMTDTDTITIAGVTFTADADGAAVGAGHFSIQASEDLCYAQLVEAINGTGTPWVDAYIDISAADRRTLKQKRVTASYDSTGDIMTVTSAWPITTAEASTAGSWGNQVAYCWFGKKGCTDLVIQSDVSIQVNKVPDKLGSNYIGWTLYGLKSFQEGKDRALKAYIVA